MAYRTGDVAAILGVSRKTVANWTREKVLHPYLSPGAVRDEEDGSSAQREFSEDDVVVLNTVRLRKTRTNSWADVAKQLADGLRDGDLPASALLVKTLSPVEQMQALMTARSELKVLQARNQDLESSLEKTEKSLDDARQEIINLNRQIAVLEYRLQQALEDDDEDDD